MKTIRTFSTFYSNSFSTVHGFWRVVRGRKYFLAKEYSESHTISVSLISDFPRISRFNSNDVSALRNVHLSNCQHFAPSQLHAHHQSEIFCVVDITSKIEKKNTKIRPYCFAPLFYPENKSNQNENSVNLCTFD